MNCEVCKGESGGEFVGVAAIPGVPMSIGWCRSCLQHEAFPAFVFEHDFIFIAEGDLANLNEWGRSRVTWADGRYMGIEEYVKRITPEQVKKELAEYNKVVRNHKPRKKGSKQ
jgi:hypothetical protein